jgi:hypothetical protein
MAKKKIREIKEGKEGRKGLTARKRKFFVRLSILAVIAIIIISSILKLSFVVRDELVLDLSPSSISINTTNRGSFSITFNARVQKFLLCRSECSYTFRDISGNTTLDSERFMLSQPSFSRQYNLSINKSGEGQLVYLFDISCRNIKSAVCSASGQDRQKSAIISVDYSLSGDERSKKAEIEAGIQEFYAEKSAYDYSINASAASMDALASVLPNSSAEEAELISMKERALSDSLSLSQQLDNISYLFSIDDYANAYSLFKNALPDAILSLFGSAKNLSDYSFIVESAYTRTIANMAALSNLNSALLPEIYNYSVRAGNSALAIEAQNVSAMIISFYSELENRSYASILSESSYSDYLLNRTDTLFLDYSNAIEAGYLSASLEARYAYLVASEFGYNGTAAGNVSSFAQKNSSLQGLSEACLLMENISGFANMHNSEASAALASSELKNSSTFLSSLNAFPQNALYDSEQQVDSEISAIENSSQYQQISALAYHGLANHSAINLAENATMDDVREMAYVNLTPGFQQVLNSTCSFLKSPCPSIQLGSIANFTLHGINYTIPAIGAPENFFLKGGTPTCCFKGSCSECCPSPACASKNYPVIFIHGHLSYDRNSPEFVINSFADMQAKFEDIAYISAGLIDMDDNVSEREWGRNPEPISVRASYYYVYYYDLGIQTVEARKSDSIENYAIRLKEIVDEVKRRTDSPKVIIVAHSMGGLVAREYLLLFGEDSVDKMVTIGTPNKGVEGAFVKLCSVFGSQKECEDMTEGSIFLKRLNNPNNIPKKTRMYTISAVGCNTYGKPGDGVIIADNVVLDFAKNYRINGTCTDLLQTNLHTRLIQPEIYPQTYEILKEIINDNLPWQVNQSEIIQR